MVVVLLIACLVILVFGLAVELRLALTPRRGQLSVRQLRMKRLARDSMPRTTPVHRWPGRV